MTSYDPLAIANSAALLIGFIALLTVLGRIATHLHVLSVSVRLAAPMGQATPLPVSDGELRSVFEKLEGAPAMQSKLHMPNLFKPWKYPED